MGGAALLPPSGAAPAGANTCPGRFATDPLDGSASRSPQQRLTTASRDDSSSGTGTGTGTRTRVNVSTPFYGGDDDTPAEHPTAA